MTEFYGCANGTINGGQRVCFALRSVAGAAQQNLEPMCGACSELWLALLPTPQNLRIRELEAQVRALIEEIGALKSELNSRAPRVLACGVYGRVV